MSTARTEIAPPSTGFAGTIQIISWKEHARGSLKGFCDITILPANLVVRGLMVLEKNGSKWLNLPRREWVDGRGEKHFEEFLAFPDRGSADKFKDACLTALNDYLQQRGEAL